MNYNMQGMMKIIPSSSPLKLATVQIKKEHQVLMVNKTTSFKKKGKERREIQEEWQASCHSREEAQSWTKA